MTASIQDISRWFDHAVEQEATHLIVVCDTYEWQDYPVYVSKDEDVHEIEEKYRGSNMQEVMEVYKMSLDKAEQMSQDRAFNY